jgi:Protein of unknown function (DUF3604)
LETPLRPDLMGSAEVSPSGRFEAGATCSFDLIYTCGTFGLDELGALRVVFRSANDQSPLQTDNPRGLGYVIAEASNGAPLEVAYEGRGHIRPWYKALTVTAKQFLREGDQIVIRIGDRRNGSPGLRLQTFCENRFEFRVLVDPIATGLFTPLAESPTIDIVAGVPVSWKALLPSYRRPGEPFALLIKAEDRWGNPSDKVSATLALTSSRPVAGLPTEVEFPAGAFQRTINGLSVPSEADVTIEVAGSDQQRLAVSNPLRVRGAAARRYWSDLHGQTEETIGTNSAREYFEFARDRAFLDICGHQGNDFQISDAFWGELNKITAEFNEPGRFLAVPGYEWSGNTGVGGDRNVWYHDEGRPIFRSSHAMVNGSAARNTACHTIVDLFGALRDENVIVSAHCGGRYADVSYAHDADKEPSVEVHSCWGTFEWIVRDALQAGYRIGIVGGSDDHKGRPGASHPGSSKFGSYGGLTCHLMDELSRDALFSSFRRRRHYATTGARVWLDVTARFGRPATLFLGNPLNGRCETEPVHSAAMGDIVGVSDREVALEIEVLGTAPIERIELRDGLDVIEVFRPYECDDLGSRIRVIWEGAESRGRARNAIWDGKARLRGNAFKQVRSINFWNADKPIQRIGMSEIAWQSFTTGSFSGFEAILADRDTGHLHVQTASANVDIAVRDIGYEDRVVEAGGLDKRIRLFRLPEDNPHHRVTLKRRIAIRETGDTRPYVCITQEDGHRAWSSPLYLCRSEVIPPPHGAATRQEAQS